MYVTFLGHNFMDNSIPNFLYNLSKALQKSNSLENTIGRIINIYKLTPVFGLELEFYLSDNFNIHLQKYIDLKDEKGANQYEIDLAPTQDALSLINDTLKAKNLMVNKAKQYNASVDFSAKPYENDYGSSIHLHLNFLNERNEQVFDNRDFLSLIASGLCFYMGESFLAFAPTENCYKRYDAKFMAPTKICWGNNNRTVAIRTPEIGVKRLEHRVASSNADLYLLFYYIIRSVELTLESKNNIPIIDKIYGNAFDTQYNLPYLPKGIKAAADIFNAYL